MSIFTSQNLIKCLFLSSKTQYFIYFQLLQSPKKVQLSTFFNQSILLSFNVTPIKSKKEQYYSSFHPKIITFEFQITFSLLFNVNHQKNPKSALILKMTFFLLTQKYPSIDTMKDYYNQLLVGDGFFWREQWKWIING